MSCTHFELNHPHCCDCNNNKIINAEENKRKYSLLNPKERKVCKIRVDECQTTEGKRCDYLFLSCENEKKAAFFIELKGKHLLHAIDQLEQSIMDLRINLGSFTINARIVLSKVQKPDLRSIKFIRFSKKIKDQGGTVIYKSVVIEEDLESS